MRDGPHELEIQNSPGDAIRGPFDRLDLRERLYKGLLTGEELVRPVGGRFTTLQSIPDFAAILQLRERGKPRSMVTRRPIKEKRASASSAPMPAAEHAASTGSADAQPGGTLQPDDGSNARAAPPPVSAAPLTKRDKRRMRTIAIVTFLVGGLVLVLAYLGYGMSL
jgi:hypothetical protein